MKLKFIPMAVFSALTLGVATSASAAPATVNGGTTEVSGTGRQLSCESGAEGLLCSDRSGKSDARCCPVSDKCDF
ncbi:S-fimbrial protein subunit SfaH [Escherichia coli HVH 98 (4-5799287)]|nr:S-fimbrial protein subunit SfaH [Escherichia coli HVH 98 (4-5799287)]